MVWVKVNKPAESSVTSYTYGEGTPIGLLLALTQSSSTVSTSVTSGWADVSKPAIASWVTVAKPTSSIWTIVAKPTS